MFVQINRCFLSKRCGATENETNGAEVELLALGVIAHHLDKDRWDKGHLLDLEALNGRKEQFEVELGKDDCLVAIVDTLLYVSYCKAYVRTVAYRSERLGPSRRCGSMARGQAGSEHPRQRICGLLRSGSSLE